MKKVIIVGISGATCSGKTTVSKELHKALPDSSLFCQDDYFFPVDYKGHIWIPEVNHINWDILSSLDMDRLTRDVQSLKEKESVSMGRFHVILVEGFCIFNHRPLAELCDLKYYFTLDYEECLRRRVKRVYEPPDVPGYFEQCVWPEHLKQLDEVRRNVSNVKYYDESSSHRTEGILRGIIKALNMNSGQF